jgi:2-dehydropantoate 2-reductase
MLLRVDNTMKILLVGAGVIGTVYGANLAAAGDTVSVLAHGARTTDVATCGLRARDVADGHVVSAAVQVLSEPSGDAYDLVLVAVRREQLSVACAPLTALAGDPTILLLGNGANREAVAPALREHVRLGFPGVGGTVVDGTVDYVRIRPQPFALESTNDPRLEELAAHLTAQGFALQRVEDMEGWLEYHAVLVACVCAALYRCGTDPQRLSRDHRTLHLMCMAMTEGFMSLRRRRVNGMPWNLRVLHSPYLTPVAVAYWGRIMGASTGELWFGAHARNAVAEMHALGADVLERVGEYQAAEKLRKLLN